MKESNKPKESALGLVLLRNSFYRDSYKRVLLAVLFVVIINVVLAFAIIYKVTTPVSPNYFPATADGRIIHRMALSLPVHTDSFIEQWATDRLSEAFRLDFIHWRAQLSEARSSFTNQGWKWFIDSLEASNNLNTLRGSSMVSSIRVTSPPSVVQSMVISGTYMWMVKMQVMLTYQNLNRTISSPNSVTMIIVRQAAKDFPDRIAINNIIMDPISNVRSTPNRQ
jgi:intracellular multiplication protein IcmL